MGTHFGQKLHETCKHLDTEGVGSITTGHLRKLFFGDYAAPEGTDIKVIFLFKLNVVVDKLF